MKKNLLRLSAVGLALTASAWAVWSAGEGDTPYFTDFSECSFSSKVPDGWVYQDDYRSGYENYSLTVNSSYGIDNSKCIQFGTQLLEADDPWGDWYDAPPRKEEASDPRVGHRMALVVTPPVKGVVSFYIRPRNEYHTGNQFWYLYDVELSGNKYVADSEHPLAYTTTTEVLPSAGTTNEWTKVTLNVGDEFKRIAFHCSNQYMDNFTAESVDIPPVYEMSILGFGVNNENNNKNIYCDENGNVTIPVKFMLTNKGNVPLTPGMENYSVDIKHNNDILYHFEVDETIQPGEDKNFTLEIPYTLADPQVDEKNFLIKAYENISGSYTISGETFQLYAYTPIMDIYKIDSASTVTSVDAGMFRGSKTVEVRLVNKGSAPLEVYDMIAGDGVALKQTAEDGEGLIDVDFPITVAAGEMMPVALVFSGNDEVLSGDVSFVSNTVESGSKVNFPYTAAAVAEGTYMNDFEDKVIPTGWLLNKTSAWKPYTNSNNNVLYSAAMASDVEKIITRKLVFDEGEKLQFAIAASSFYSSPYPYLKVYYSTDRANWVELLNIQGDSKGGDYAYPSPTYKYFSAAMPEGEYFIAFEGMKTYLDNVFGGKIIAVPHDLYLSDFKATASVMANYPVKASVKATNYGDYTEGAESYDLNLMCNGKVVATAEAVDIENGVSGAKSFEFSFVPHEVMEDADLQVVFATKDGSYSVGSEVAKLNVIPEVMVSDVTVGEITSKTSSNSPIRSIYNNSITLMTYKAEMMSEMIAGDKIAKLTFYYKYDADDVRNRNTRLWIANGNDIVSFGDTTRMTEVFNATIEYNRTTPEVEGMYQKMEFMLPATFEYDGTGVQIMWRSECSSYKTTPFAKFDATNGASVQAYDDDYILSNGTSYKDKSKNYYSELPVISFGLDKEAVTVNGMVTDRETMEPVANAFVEMVATDADIIYTAQTDETGSFTMPLFQPDHEFEGTVFAHLYADGKVAPASYLGDTEALDLKIAHNNVESTSLVVEQNGSRVSLAWDHVTPGRVDDAPVYEIEVNGNLAGSTEENSFEIEDINQFAGLARSVNNDICLYTKFGEDRTSGTSTLFETVKVSDMAADELAIKVVANGVHIEAPAEAVVTVVTGDGAVVNRIVVEAGVTELSLEHGLYVINVVCGDAKVGKTVLVK